MVDFKSLTKSKPLRIASAGVGGVVVLGAAAAVAQTVLAPSDGVINGCVDKAGRLRVIDPNQACKKGETSIQWNQQGPIGPVGPIGPQGLQGLQGPPGADGALGPQGAAGPQGADGRDGRDGLPGGGGGLPPSPVCELGGVNGDVFVKVAGIEGDSLDSKHKGEIDVLAFGWGGITQRLASTGGGAGAGKPEIGPICFLKTVDSATTPLILAAVTGKHIQDTLVTFRKAGKEQLEYLKIKLTDILVSSIKTSGGGSDALPSEVVTLDFAAAEITQCSQRPDGTIGDCNTIRFDHDGKL